MNKVLLLFAAMFMTSAGVPIAAQEAAPEYEISIPENGDLIVSDRMEAGKRYLIGDDFRNLCKPLNDDGTMHIGRSYTYPNPGTQLDESFFWTVEVPAESTDGRVLLKHVQSGEYIATLQYGETCTMTADIASAAKFEVSGSGFLQPDNEGGLGLYSDERSDRFMAGWDEDNERPKLSGFYFYDVDANNIIREKVPEPERVSREVTLTLPQHNGEDVVVKAQYYDGDKVDVSNLPYFGCFTATGFAERSRTVSETNCSFTVKGTWDEPIYTETERIFAIASYLEDWNFNANEGWSAYSDNSCSMVKYSSDMGQGTVPAERKFMWYLKNLRFDNGNYLVTLSNAMAPEGTALTSDAEGNLSFTDTPTEFILAKTYANYGSSKEEPRISLVYCVDGKKKFCFSGNGTLKHLIEWSDGVNIWDDTYPAWLSFLEPTNETFDAMRTIEVNGVEIPIDAAKREAAKQSRSIADYLAMFEPAAIDLAKIRYAELAGFEYGTAAPAVKLPGNCDVNDPILTALATAIEGNDETALEAALEAAKNVTVCASADYTEGAKFRLMNMASYMTIDKANMSRLTCSELNNTKDALEFAIVNYGDKNYIYCTTYGMFLSATGNQLVTDYSNSWTLSDAQSATPIDFVCLNKDAAIDSDSWLRDFGHNADIVVAGSDPALYCGLSDGEIVVRTLENTTDGFAGCWNFDSTGRAMTADELAAVYEKLSPRGIAISMYERLRGVVYNSPYRDMALPGYPDVNDPRLVALADAIEDSDDDAMADAMAALEGTTMLEPTDGITEGMVFGLYGLVYNETYQTNFMVPIGLDNKRGLRFWYSGGEAKFAVVKYDGKNYLYNLNQKAFVCAYNSVSGQQVYIVSARDVPAEFTFGVNKTGVPPEQSSKQFGIDVIGGRVIDSEGHVDGAFGWSQCDYDEPICVKPYDGWHGDLSILLDETPQFLTETLLNRLRANIAAAIEEPRKKWLEWAENTGTAQIVNYPTPESIKAVANDETLPADYLDWLYSYGDAFECHELTNGSVYTVTCWSSYWYEAPADSDTDVWIDPSNLQFKAFAVDGDKCVLRDLDEDNAFNWLCNIADDGSISFVHYVPAESLQRETSVAPVYLSLPAEHLGAHADVAEPQSVFSNYGMPNGKCSGVVALPVANYSDASKTVWLPNLQIRKVSDNAMDAGATTSIVEVESVASDDEVFYDLSGRRVAHPTAGHMYIVRSGARTVKRVIR